MANARVMGSVKAGSAARGVLKGHVGKKKKEDNL